MVEVLLLLLAITVGCSLLIMEWLARLETRREPARKQFERIFGFRPPIRPKNLSDDQVLLMASTLEQLSAGELARSNLCQHHLQVGAEIASIFEELGWHRHDRFKKGIFVPNIPCQEWSLSTVTPAQSDPKPATT